MRNDNSSSTNFPHISPRKERLKSCKIEAALDRIYSGFDLSSELTYITLSAFWSPLFYSLWFLLLVNNIEMIKIQASTSSLPYGSRCDAGCIWGAGERKLLAATTMSQRDDAAELLVCLSAFVICWILYIILSKYSGWIRKWNVNCFFFSRESFSTYSRNPFWLLFSFPRLKLECVFHLSRRQQLRAHSVVLFFLPSFIHVCLSAADTPSTQISSFWDNIHVWVGINNDNNMQWT